MSSLCTGQSYILKLVFSNLQRLLALVIYRQVSQTPVQRTVVPVRPQQWVPFGRYYLAPGGGCEVLFSPGLSVCLSVCLCVCLCVCPANILVFYFSAIRRDIDLKFIQDTYRVVPHRSKVKVTGTVHCFLKVQSYHKN